MDLRELLERQAKAQAEKPAVIFRGQPLSFRQLQEAAFSCAAGLSGLGLQKGEKAAIFLPNIPEYIYSLLGVFILRGVAVPLDFMLTEEELVNFINHSEAKVLIAQEKKDIRLAQIKMRCPGLREIVCIGADNPDGFTPWQQFLDSGKSAPQANADDKDYAAIFYTSGSTGHPKGVVLDYGHLQMPLNCFEYFLHPTEKDSLISPGIPFSHLGGLDYLLFMLHFGITLVLLERFHPIEFLQGIAKYRPTIFCIVPSMYVVILSLKEFEQFDLSSLRYAVVFGAPSSAALLQRFNRACPQAFLLNGWGMTETSAPNAFLPTGANTKEIPHTGEFAPGTEIKIVDEELWIKGRAVMASYYKEPGLTAEALTADGWLKTGDIFRRDPQGRYYIVGRKKEMLKVGGEIVFYPEVEEAIQRHPKVKEAAVLGVADQLRGEVPKAFVAAKEGEKLEAEELRYFLRGHLAHFKIPHQFQFVPALPKNRVGKIDKEKLRDTL